MIKLKAFIGSFIIGIGLGLIHYALPIVLVGVIILFSSYTDYANDGGDPKRLRKEAEK